MPSVKRTVVSVSSAMFGFGVTSPCAMRERMSSDTVGCASQQLVVGLGQPVALHVADDQPQRRALHPLADGERDRADGASVSSGRPNTYLGITHAPRRAAR